MTKKQPPPEGKQSTRVPPGKSLASYWWESYIGVAVIALLMLGAAVVLLTHQQRLIIERNLEGVATALAGQLDNRTVALRRQLAELRDDPSLASLFRQEDRRALAAKEAELAATLNDAVRVHLLTARDVHPGGSAGERLSHAGVDMVGEAGEQLRISPLEVHLVGRRDEHLAIAGPVTDGGTERLVGVIHVVLPLTLLPAAGDAGGGPIAFRFYQKVAGQQVPVYPRHVEDPPAEALTKHLEVGHSRLMLEVWELSGGLRASWTMMSMGALYLGALLLFGLMVWLPYRRLHQNLEADLSMLGTLAKAAVRGQSPRLVPSRLKEVRGEQKSLRALAREVAETKTIAAAPAFAPTADAPFAMDMDGAEAADRGGVDAEDGVPADRDPPADAVEPADTGVIDDLSLDAFDAAPAKAEDKPPVAAPAPRVSAALLADGADAGEAEDMDLPGPLRFDFDEEDGDDDAPLPAGGGADLPDSVFRAYDIRGIVDKELSEGGMELLGRAIGSEARAMGSDTCVVARDLRPDSERLARALIAGLQRTGCNVIDLGIAPIPVLYQTAQARGSVSGAMVTASHNPVEYNGLKFVLAGQPATEAQIRALRDRIRAGEFFEGAGSRREETAFDAYIDAVIDDITLARRMKLVIDCGHGTASLLAERLFRALGCEVIPLDCDPERAKTDHRMADPSQPSHLGALGDAVRNVSGELGVGFDPDGDRLGVIDSAGRFVAGDRVLMLLAADVLARRPGSDIVYDVKCSPSLGEEILRNGGRPVMWKSGHSYLKQKLYESGGAFGGELSGHIVFRDRWNGFDDAFYAAARLLEVLALDPRPSAEVFAALPLGLVTPELFAALSDETGQDAMKRISALADRLDAIDIDPLDGLRASFEHGWGLVRASNTQSGLVFRFEGRNPESLVKIQEAFRGLLHEAVPGLALPF